MSDSNRALIDFSLDLREGIWVVQYSDGSCRPASGVESALWLLRDKQREISAISRGAIQHLLKREIPEILLELAKLDEGESEVTVSDDFIASIESTIAACESQLKAVYTAPMRESFTESRDEMRARLGINKRECNE